MQPGGWRNGWYKSCNLKGGYFQRSFLLDFVKRPTLPLGTIGDKWEAKGMHGGSDES